ncbi:hypothetical protein PIB30_105862, partial [Stylosanthes scabra]|nr:hypothetical protein [Stylosanthes scabra]
NNGSYNEDDEHTPLPFPGHCQCTKSNLSVKQVKNGLWSHGKPQWKVTITNNCDCSLKNVFLNCRDLGTTADLGTTEPSILTLQGNQCIINSRQPFKGSLMFTYAIDNPFPFTPIHAESA